MNPVKSVSEFKARYGDTLNPRVDSTYAIPFSRDDVAYLLHKINQLEDELEDAQGYDYGFSDYSDDSYYDRVFDSDNE